MSPPREVMDEDRGHVPAPMVGDSSRSGQDLHATATTTVEGLSSRVLPFKGSTEPPLPSPSAMFTAEVTGAMTSPTTTVVSGQSVHSPRAAAAPNSSRRRRSAGRTTIPVPDRERYSSPYRSESEPETDEEDTTMHTFVPGERVDKAVLEAYVARFVDKGAKVTAARHPVDKTRQGYNCSARRSLKAVDQRAIIADSLYWETERQGETFRAAPYSYLESITYRRRVTAPTPVPRR